MYLRSNHFSPSSCFPCTLSPHMHRSPRSPTGHWYSHIYQTLSIRFRCPPRNLDVLHLWCTFFFSSSPPVNLSHAILSDTFYDKRSAIDDALRDNPPIFPRDSSSRKAGPVEQWTGLVEAQLRHQLKEDILQVSVWSCMLTYVPFMTTV